MVNIAVKIEGLDEFAEGIRRAPQQTTSELSKAINKSLLTIESQAKKEAPANKGISTGNTLRQNIKARMTSKLAGEVVASRPYALYVHEGTRPHIIVPVYKKVLANKRTGEFFGTLVHHPGTRPNPFFERAIRNSTRMIEQFFNQALQNVIKVLQ
jgi:HK97 gp10 family phage protein